MFVLFLTLKAREDIFMEKKTLNCALNNEIFL